MNNPYSESLFRTLKHTPAYPRLPCDTQATANAWVGRFVRWYNSEHRHSGIHYVTPNQRHLGEDIALLAKRTELYEAARTRHPMRWTRSARNWNPVTTVLLDPQANLRPSPA